MTNNEQRHGVRDWTCINLKDEFESAYWVKKLGYSREMLIKAMNNVGPVVEDIEQYLAQRK